MKRKALEMHMYVLYIQITVLYNTKKKGLPQRLETSKVKLISKVIDTVVIKRDERYTVCISIYMCLTPFPH